MGSQRQRRSAWWKFVAATIVLLIISRLCLVLVASAADRVNAFELATTDVAILNSDTRQVIGHGHYQVTPLDGGTLFEGENRYLDGEYDREVQRVERIGDRVPPILVSYEHSFFAADGSPESLDTLDAKTGILACTHYDAGAPDVRQSRVEVPNDTYAGSTAIDAAGRTAARGRARPSRCIRSFAFPVRASSQSKSLHPPPR